MAAKRKKREDTSIDQMLYPRLEDIGIPRNWIRRNTTTLRSGLERGDLWISDVEYSSPNFEKRILALIECKDSICTLGDSDWQDAVRQGMQKAFKQGLNSFFVTNTASLTRCYNTDSLEEVTLDGVTISEVQPIPTLRAIQTQVSPKNSKVFIASFGKKNLDPKEFRTSLWNLRQIYRGRGISKGSEDSMIKTTLTFGILKLITEQQKIQRTLPDTILLWDDWREGRLDSEIENTIQDLLKIPAYRHLKDCLFVDPHLDAEACVEIKREFSRYNLYGSDFDFFGLIYEALANKDIKKDFGEFYTPRHLIRSIVKLRLSAETKPRPLTICDPSCGTGGFLVEAFLYLQRSFEQSKSLDPEVLERLKSKTFHGFDTNEKVAIPFARTNMLMADDGGIHIAANDSLVELPEDTYDYILTNIPYGNYDGKAPLENFNYSKAKRFETLFIEKIVRALRKGGKAAVIVPDGLVESTSNSRYREKLLFDVEMEAVVSLPGFVFEPYTSEKTYVLFFRKKRPSEAGRLQETPIYHFIVDQDGFQDGKKRFPIAENDFPLLEQAFRQDPISEKAGLVPISEVNSESYFSLCSEYYLRRPKPIEMSEDDFTKVIENAERLISQTSGGAE